MTDSKTQLEMAVERLALENSSLKREVASLRRMVSCNVDRDSNPCKKAHLTVRLVKLDKPVEEKFGSQRTHTGTFVVGNQEESLLIGRVSRRVKNGVVGFSVFSLQATQSFKHALACQFDPPKQGERGNVEVRGYTTSSSLSCSRVRD